MLESCTGCFGGEVAGPIATQVMECPDSGMRLEAGAA